MEQLALQRWTTCFRLVLSRIESHLIFLAGAGRWAVGTFFSNIIATSGLAVGGRCRAFGGQPRRCCRGWPASRTLSVLFKLDLIVLELSWILMPLILLPRCACTIRSRCCMFYMARSISLTSPRLNICGEIIFTHSTDVFTVPSPLTPS